MSYFNQLPSIFKFKQLTNDKNKPELIKLAKYIYAEQYLRQILSKNKN